MKDKLFLKENFFVEFIGVTLVNKIIQVSGVQFYNSHLYIVLCVHPSQVSFHRIYTHYTSSICPYPLPLW